VIPVVQCAAKPSRAPVGVVEQISTLLP